MFKLNKIVKNIAFIFGVFALSFSLNYAVLAVWQEPLLTPPDGNVDAPLNAGTIGQVKTGGLILNTGGAATGLIIDKGNVGIGTTTPGTLLNVYGDDPSNRYGSYDAVFRIKGDNYSYLEIEGTGSQAGILLNRNGSTGWFMGLENSAGYLRLTDLATIDEVGLTNAKDGSEGLTITTTGSVGIGNKMPGAKLDIVGTIKIVDGSQGLGKVLTSDASGLASWQDPSSAIGTGQYFSDGSDGDVTISSTTTLTRNMNYNNLIINSGVTLYPNGYLISVKNTLTNNGTISMMGNNGAGGSCGVGGSGLPSRYTGGSYSGGNGGTSGYSGTGGVGIGGSAGGGGGPACCPGSGGGNITKLYSSPSLLVVTRLLQELGGAGGGGSGSGVCGCGGGSGGGTLGIFAKNAINNGIITVKGGNGASCTTGGGGGGGGAIVLIYSSKSGSGTFDISGGNGGVGSSCCNGVNGMPGNIYFIPI